MMKIRGKYTKFKTSLLFKERIEVNERVCSWPQCEQL